jgi:hypothetical protein
MRRALAILIAAAAASFAGPARRNATARCRAAARRTAPTPQCRAAGAGRCSPMSWLELERPARRAVSAAAPADGYPRMLVDPPSYVPSTNTDMIFDRHHRGW